LTVPPAETCPGLRRETGKSQAIRNGGGRKGTEEGEKAESHGAALLVKTLIEKRNGTHQNCSGKEVHCLTKRWQRTVEKGEETKSRRSEGKHCIETCT